MSELSLTTAHIDSLKWQTSCRVQSFTFNKSSNLMPQRCSWYIRFYQSDKKGYRLYISGAAFSEVLTCCCLGDSLSFLIVTCCEEKVFFLFATQRAKIFFTPYEKESWRWRIPFSFDRDFSPTEPKSWSHVCTGFCNSVQCLLLHIHLPSITG